MSTRTVEGGPISHQQRAVCLIKRRTAIQGIARERNYVAWEGNGGCDRVWCGAGQGEVDETRTGGRSHAHANREKRGGAAGMMVLVVFVGHGRRRWDFLSEESKEHAGRRGGQRANTDPRWHQQTHRDEQGQTQGGDGQAAVTSRNTFLPKSLNVRTGNVNVSVPASHAVAGQGIVSIATSHFRPGIRGSPPSRPAIPATAGA